MESRDTIETRKNNRFPIETFIQYLDWAVIVSSYQSAHAAFSGSSHYK